MSDDAELLAMAAVKDSLDQLDADARQRVIWWAANRFGVSVKGIRGVENASGDESEELDGREVDGRFGGSGHDERSESREYAHFAEMFDAAGVSVEAERVLVAAYWTQVQQGASTFGSQELNKLLKDLGHGIGTINKAMSRNIAQKPALILQVSRSGSSQQSRKKYKLTDAGKKWVEARLVS